MSYTKNTRILSPVLVPDVDEESVDIYDGLEINPSSNAGKRYFYFGLVQNDSLSNII